MTIAKSVLASYRNGNTQVILYSDGSKVREYLDTARPRFPESVDLKITDFCDMNCSFCHEQSTIQGKHASLESILNITKDLPSGVELAIGGGNPLAHPDLEELLLRLKSKGIIANITINQGHLKPYKELISKLIEEDLVKGVGVSLTKKKLDLKYLPKTPHLVFHIIIGIQTPSIIDNLLQHIKRPKILLLGYKEYGFGIKFFNPSITENIDLWKMFLSKYFDKALLSFDNLAIEQLKVKRLFTEEGWQKFYMGDDGMFTMYIDAITNTYAVSSTKDRLPIESRSIKDIFQNLDRKQRRVF